MEQVRKSGTEAARNTRVTRDYSSAGRRMPAPYLRAGLRSWVTCVLLMAGTASGATRTWTGAGGNDNWSTSANWGGIAPLPGDDLVFAGSTRLTPNNDMTPGTSFNSITFSAGSGLFTVGGNYIALTGGASAIVSNASGGVMIFNNPITFNAAPTISAAAGGMLELGGSLSAGAFNTAWNCSGNIGINGVLSGTGSLTKNGSGALQLNGANTYTGTTNVAAGVIVLNNVSALGTTAAGTTVAAGSALDLKGVNYSAPEPLTLNGTGLAGGGALINSAVAPATFAGLITLGSSASIMGGAGTIAITHPGTITGTGYNLVLGGNAGGALKSNLATGSGALTKQDNGAWVLTGSNTYTGATTVSAGALVPLNPSALGGTSSGTTVTAGATLDLHGVNYTNPEPLTLNGLGPGNVGALSNDSIGAATFAGLITLGSSSSVKCGAGPISLTHSGTITGTGFSLTLGGNSSGDLASIVGTGSGALTKTDAGNWTLSGHNTYNGPTTINAGTLILGAADVIPDGSDVTAHGTLEMNGFSETIGSLAGTGFVDNSAGSGTFTLTTGGTSVQTTFSGVIKNTAQTVALTKEGAAYMLLTGNNTYAGLTTVNGGVLSIGDNGTTGTLSGNCVVASGAAVRFARSDAQTYSGNISGAGQVMKINAGALTMTGTSTYTGSTLITGGAFTIGSGSTYGSVTGTLILAGGGSGSIVFNRSDNLTYSGQITGTDATGSVVKNGPNTLTLSGANDYTGATLVNSGILTLGNPDALGSSAGGTTVASGAALDLGGVNYTKAESLTLNGTGIAYNGALMNTSATQAGFAGPITLGSAASIVGGPNSGIDIANTGAISGGYPLTLGGSQGGFLAGTLPGGDLIKEGTGGWTLTGVNPLALANLTLSGGTLFLGAGLTHSVSTNLSLTGGILDFGSSTLRFSGSSANFSSLSGVVPGTGTLDFNGTTGIQAYTPQNTAANPSVTHSGAGTLRLNFALNCQSFSQTAGILDFNGYDLTTVNGGGFTISNGNAASISGLDGRMVTVAGNVSLTGASANSPLNLDPVSVWYLSGHGTINVSKASLRYANASYNPGVCADCRDLGNNANWGFPITWDGGGSNTSWSTAENWGSKSVPTRYQDAIFNSTSSKDVMLTADVEVRSLTFASGYMGRLDFSSHKLTIAAGDADFQGDEAISAGTGTLEFAGDGAQNLRPKSGTLLPDIVKGGAGTTMVAGQLAAGSLALAGGVFHLGNTALTQSVGAVSGTGGLEFGSANLSARGNVDLYTINVIATTANTLAFTGTSAQTYRPKLSEPDLNLMQNGSVSTTLIGDLNTPVLTLASGTFGFGVNRIATISSSVVSTGGDVDFGTANTLNFTGGTFDLSGLTNVLPGTGTIYFQSATTQTFIPHPTATHPGIVRSTGGGLLDLNGNFKGQYMRVETGTLNLGSGRAHEIGTFSSSGGTLDFGSSSLRISGSSANFANLSAMVAGTGLLEFTGSGGQAFAPHASAFPSIRQSGSGTTALSANDLTCGNLDVTGGEFDVAARALNPTGTVSVSAGTLNVTGGIAAIIGNLSVTGGALRLPASNSFGVTGNITIASAAAIYHNSGTITLNGTTAGRTIDIDNTIYAITLNGAGGEWTVVNHGLFGDGALTLSAGTLKLGASPMNSMGSLASNSSAATLDFGASTLRILYGSANFTGLAALVPGTGTLDFNNLTGTQMLTPMNGSVTHPIVTHTGAGAFQLAAYPLVCKGFLNSAGGLDFNGRDITVNNGGDFSITNGTPATIAGLDGATITVAGTATLAGASSGSRLNLSPAGNWTLAATGALTGSFLTLGNSNASVQAGACSNCSANTGNSNWTFSTSWDGGGGDYKWSTAANWGSDAVPSASEDVAFDGLSNDNALLDVDGAVKSITFTNGYSGDFSFTTHTLSVTGGIANFSSGGNIIAGTGTLAFTGTGAQTFIPKTGMSFPNIHQNGNAGTTTVSGAALTAGNLTLGLGTFNLGAGMTHTVNGISGAGALNFGSSDVNAKGDVDLGSATLSAAAGRILAFIGLTAQNYVPNASETGLSLIQNGNGGTTILASNVSAPSLTILNGTLHLGAGLTHTIASTFTVTGGGLDFGSSTLKLQAADVDLRLLSALTPGTGILQFTRASSQTFVPHASLPLPRVEQFGTGVTTVTTNPIVTADILMIRNGAFQLGTGLTHVVGGVNGSGGVGTLDFGTSNLKVSAGNAYLGNLAGVTTTGTGSLEFSAASGTQIFTTLAGFTNPAIVHSGAGTLRQGSATSFTSFNQSSGTMDLNGYDLAT
ncbi:MAG: autotransporter-associated beta strand repeat-containing protein, partial [Fibrobacteria bacterium]